MDVEPGLRVVVALLGLNVGFTAAQYFLSVGVSLVSVLLPVVLGIAFTVAVQVLVRRGTT